MTDSFSRNAQSQSGSKKNPPTTPDSIPAQGLETQELMTYLAQFENLDNVREFVGHAAQKCGLDASAIFATQLAVDEAFSNIIEHSYGGECFNKIECKCQTDNSGLTITLRDCGTPFDPSVVPNPDLAADLEDRDIGGLGLYFIHQLMDEVEFTFTPDPETGKPCNVIRMRKLKES